MGFDELRKEGVEPRDYAPDEWKRVHNDHSVGGRSGEGLPVVSSRKTEELVEIYRKLEREEMIEKGKKQPEWKLEDLMRDPNVDYEEEGRKKIEEEGGLVEIEKKPSDARNACVVDEFENAVDEVVEATEDSDVPRQKTEEELEADARRIEEKDRRLQAELDNLSLKKVN
jgi:hypothetical protein